MRRFFGILLFTLAIPLAVMAGGRVEGILFERGTKKPLADVNVFVLPMKLKATTDKDGKFSLDGIPAGDAEFVVNFPGYMKLDETYEVEEGVTQEVKLFLQRTTYHGLEATVVGHVAKRDDTTKTLRSEQFLTVPGAGGDPVKAVQNLPGVARVGGFSSQVVIQGSAPQDTVYQLDEHQVPLVFHFGGLTSVITPEAIDSVDYLSAGYGPEYGRAMGGIVGLRTRDPKTDRRQGFVFMDTMKAGGLIEAPIDEKSSYLIAGRYSYIGYVLGALVKDRSSFDMTVVPAFGDFTGIYKTKPNARDEFRVVTIYSHDELSFLFKEPIRTEPSLRGNFSNTVNFYRLIPQWTRRLDQDRTLRASLGLGQNLIHVDVGSNYFDLEETVVSNRFEYEWRLAPSWKSHAGLDNEFSTAIVKLKLPQISGGGGVSNPISTGQLVETEIRSTEIVAAPYWRNVIRTPESSWTWMPNLRVDYFNITQEIRPQPRLAARYDIDDSLKLKSAAGIYYQAPQPQEVAKDYGNPDLKSPFAYHYTIGTEKDFRKGTDQGWSLNASLFYRDFQNLVVSSSRFITRDGVSVPEKYSNEGRGRAQGAECLLKYDGKPWAGWISYTLSQSFRTEPGQNEHASQYDQTHNLNFVASYDFTRNWKLSGRARYVTGNPTTPIVGGTFDSDNDVYLPVRGPFYSERNDAFFQLDARVDKKWVHDTWILWGYLDIQNVSNQRNSEGVRYSYDYSQKQSVTGLPLIPTLGVKGEF